VSDNQHLWGLDLGGTKVECVVLQSKDAPNVLARERIYTEKENGYRHILNRIKLLVDNVAEQVGSRPTRIGIGTPGTLDPPTQTLKNSNSTELNGQPFKRDLEELLGVELMLANDANCFALAEARMGIVPQLKPKAKVVFGVIMGTGVGGGVVVNGQVINGLQGIGGEWGHNYLDLSGGDCYCGKKGCVEKVISGPATERFYKEISGKSLSLKEINTAYKAKNDPHAKATIDRLCHFFGIGLSSIINVLDPDVIVIGGGVGNVDALYTQGVREVEKFVFNNRLETMIVRPKLGDSAGVFGAAFLVAE